MRLSSATLLICAVLTLCVPRNSQSADDEPAKHQQPAENPAEKPTNKSAFAEKAVVKDIVYGLEQDENRLYLSSQPLDGVDRQWKRVELTFAGLKDGRIDEMSLAKLNGKNLMAVIKVQRGNEFDFHCLTFIGPWNGGHIRDRFGFHQAKFFTTREDLKILAVGGKHFQGSVFIVLGEMGLDEKGEDWVTEGAFYFSGCPWPPSDGTLTKFRVTKSLDFGGTD